MYTYLLNKYVVDNTRFYRQSRFLRQHRTLNKMKTYFSLVREHIMKPELCVTIPQGKLIGKECISAYTEDKYYAFCGIPYAKPPIKNLRFKVSTIVTLLIRKFFKLVIVNFAIISLPNLLSHGKVYSMQPKKDRTAYNTHSSSIGFQDRKIAYIPTYTRQRLVFSFSIKPLEDTFFANFSFYYSLHVK